MILEEILQATKKSLETGSTKARFKFGTSQEQAADLIRAAYITNLKRRGQEYINDEATEKHINSAASWLTDGKKYGLLLFGGIGNGKTTLSDSIFNVLVAASNEIRKWENNSDNSPRFNAQPVCPARKDLCFGFPERISTLELVKSAYDTEKFTRIKFADFLFLDDLGTEPSTIKNFGTEISPVAEILYNRYESLLPTIATTNCDKAGLRAFYGPRIADRLEEFCDTIGFNNKSYRK